MTVLLRKASPGSDSYGHVWATARSVVEVSDAQAADLLAIVDAGFTVVVIPTQEDPPPTPPAPAPAAVPDEKPVLEIDPAKDTASAAPAPPAAPVPSPPPAKPRKHTPPRRHAE